jgi:glycosyltransferase involved in cell wall biosynthesis
VVETLTPEAGSVGVCLPGLFDALRRHGIESQVLTADRTPAHTFERAVAARLLEKHNVVHIHGWGSNLAHGAAKLAQKSGKPYVLAPHGALCETVYNKKTWKDKLSGLLGEDRLVQRASVATAVNDDEERNLQRRHVHTVRLLPYGLTFADYESASTESVVLPPPLKGRCVLLLGPVHPIEGFVPLLRGLAEIGKDAEDWHMVLAGRQTGDWRKMLEAAARRKGALGRVMFASAPDVATQRAWLARASILAATSLHVRSPVSLMQAVAAGVPVIATHHVAPATLDGAIRICGPSRQEIKEALHSVLMLSDDERAAMARKARDAGRKMFDWPILAEKYVQLYRGLA